MEKSETLPEKKWAEATGVTQRELGDLPLSSSCSAGFRSAVPARPAPGVQSRSILIALAITALFGK